MRPILNYACILIALIIFCSCTKEQLSVSNKAIINSTNTSLVTSQLIGRQQQITVSTGDHKYPTSKALLWLPTGYDWEKRSEKTYPLIISLVGSGENGNDINMLLQTPNIARRISDGWNAYVVDPITKVTTKFIVFTPQCPVSWGWSAKQIKKMLAELEAEYRIDETRVYITGYSAGGWGLWSCITDDVSLCKQFAAIAPISTASADHPDKITNVDKYGIACWDICGTQDAFYKNAVNYTNIINSNKPPIKAILTSLNGVGHSAWIQAYNPNWTSNDNNLYEWFLKYHK